MIKRRAVIGEEVDWNCRPETLRFDDEDKVKQVEIKTFSDSFSEGKKERNCRRENENKY